MGCCESRISPENCINIITKNRKTDLHSMNLKFSDTPKFNDEDLNKANTNANLNTNTKIDTEHKIKKSEIPLTREVRVPSVEIPYEIIRTKKRLALTVIEANFLSEGTVLHVNPGGLEGSERMAKDGIVTFGIKNEEYLNDFNFPEGELVGARHFEIKYDITKDSYRIKNLFGSGLFIKIQKKTLLRNNAIFSFVNSHLIATISVDQNLLEQVTDAENISSIINLKVIYGVNQNMEYEFDSSKQNVIKIGRIKTTSTDIALPDENISRVQCTIFYENNNWYICDGSGTKESMNGTWYLADEYIDIYENMVFRAGSTSFSANFYYPQL